MIASSFNLSLYAHQQRKLLAYGLSGFFDEPKGIGKIMQELLRQP